MKSRKGPFSKQLENLATLTKISSMPSRLAGYWIALSAIRLVLYSGGAFNLAQAQGVCNLLHFVSFAIVRPRFALLSQKSTGVLPHYSVSKDRPNASKQISSHASKILPISAMGRARLKMMSRRWFHA